MLQVSELKLVSPEVAVEPGESVRSSDETFLELIRQLRTSAQLRHSWSARVYQAKGLHPAAAWLLAELDHRGECRPSDLARSRMVDGSVISRQIAQLTEADLVDRRPAPEDGRASLITVSERGREMLAGLREDQLALLRAALGEWAPGELGQLADRLRVVNEDLREYMGMPAEGTCTTTDETRPIAAGK